MSAQLALGTVAFCWRGRRRRSSPPAPAVWPRVTVQLPIRNEYYTALRVIEAAAALDYPKECLEIQILDDSDDETVGVIVQAVARLRQQGLDIVQLRRFTPTDFKAGALGYGVRLAKGEFLAMFDADFVPPRDFLRRTVPWFGDPLVALVQGRWEHRNRTASWFTRLQAQILDGIMVVEETAKSDAGLPFQFNGTAGVWRRSAIEAAGGWRFDSLTEDLDLSMRAEIAGFRLVHLPDLAVASELPTTLGLFRVQQRRWALGTAQLLRKRLGTVLGARTPLASRMAHLFQLLRHFGYPLLVVMVLTVPLTTFGHVRTLVDYGWGNAIVLGAALASVAAEHAVAARAIGQSVLRALVLSPLTIALAIGLSPTYTVALWYGLRDRAGPFHRTPKVTRTPGPGEPVYRATPSVLIGVELAVGLAYVGFTVLAFARGEYPESAFLGFVSGSFLLVGLGSLQVSAIPAPSSRA